MWHDIVSTLNRTADAAVSQAISAFMQHPFTMSGFLLVLFILSVMLLTEVSPDETADAREAKPILIRR